MGKRAVTLADINPKCLAANAAALQAAASSPGSKRSPSDPSPGVQTAEKVKKGREMTRTEREFEAMLRRENPGCTVLFERYTFKLSTDCRYTPDFSVVHSPQNFHRIDLYEVKGAHLFRGATKSATHSSLTKPKLAAELFPWHRWFRATKAKDGTWTREEYRAAA